MPTTMLTAVSRSAMSGWSETGMEPKVYSPMYSHLPMQAAHSSDRTRAQRHTTTPSPISCSRSRRLLSPITLRVLMLRRRTGACDMEKLAKLMRATSSNSTTASCSMQYTVLLPLSVSGSCPSIKVLSNGSAENRILPRYSFISFELTPYSVHTSPVFSLMWRPSRRHSCCSSCVCMPCN